MLKLVVLASLLALAFGQAGHHFNFILLTVGDYRVEYDDNSNIILLVGKDSCYIVEAEDKDWDDIVTDKVKVQAAAEDIIELIKEDKDVVTITFDDSRSTYRSRLEQWQCHTKNIGIIKYTPGDSVATTVSS